MKLTIEPLRWKWNKKVYHFFFILIEIGISLSGKKVFFSVCLICGFTLGLRCDILSIIELEKKLSARRCFVFLVRFDRMLLNVFPWNWTLGSSVLVVHLWHNLCLFALTVKTQSMQPSILCSVGCDSKKFKGLEIYIAKFLYDPKCVA